VNSYQHEYIARQRLDQSAQAARNAHQQQQLRKPTRRAFPRLNWPTRPRTTLVIRPV
jgi:hypothetical protein